MSSGIRIATDLMQEVAQRAASARRLRVSDGGNSRIRQSRVRKGQISQQELAIRFAKGLLSKGHHLQHRHGLEKVTQNLSGSGLSAVFPHYTNSLLSSASLMASHIKNRLIRNQESISSMVLRNIVGLGEMRNSIWKHNTSQDARKLQIGQAIDSLELRKELIQIQSEALPDNAALKNRALQMDATLKKLRLLNEYMASDVAGNIHPDSLLTGARASLTPSEAALLPSPLSTIRGVLIRVKGPRKGNRALKLQKAAGRVSVNSVNYVNSEECNIQLPSKLGIFGLYIRLVYSKMDKLLSPHTKIPIAGQDQFQFKNII